MTEVLHLVAKDGLAARQWEGYLLRERMAAGEQVWISPDVVTLRQWLAELWVQAPGDRADLITARQSRALWRAVVDASAEGLGLIDAQGPAQWAEQAWRLLSDWAIDPADLKASAEQEDFAAFLEWCAMYRTRLAAAGWIDTPELQRQLPNPASIHTDRIGLLDHSELAPAHQMILTRLETAGWRVEHRGITPSGGHCRRIELVDPAEELRAALRWGVERAGGGTGGLVAVVVPDLARRRVEVAALLEATDAASVPSSLLTGRPVRDNPFVAAAVDALELLSPSGGFAHLSRCLRSPFLHSLEQLPAMARLELRLRSELFAQLPFVEAYRACDLARWFERRAPELGSRLASALRVVEFGSLRQAPIRWVSTWQAALGRLGWGSFEQSVDAGVVASWESALQAFAELTPVTGPLTARSAVAALKAILEEPGVEGPLTLRGLHIVADMDQVGPGYDAAWVTGLTESSWPPPARLNPLLPRRLQAEHGMPWASPADAVQRAQASMDRLRARVPLSIFSWPATLYDYPSEPSPLLRDVEAFELPRRDAAQRDATRHIVLQRDPAPPVASTTVRGGSQTLNHQASCPLRAFCQSRLGARAIPALPRGVPSRLQGTIAHRALQCLIAPTQDLPEDPEALQEAIRSAAEQALRQTFRTASKALGALYELEQERLESMLRQLLAAEAGRTPHVVEQVEARADIEIDAYRIAARIDRIDRVASDATAILDYKTGRTPVRPEWFGPRLRDTQLPLYVLEQGAGVAAAVVVALSSQRCRYLGYWPTPGMFPGRSIEISSWPEQCATWRRQIETLLREYVAGDVRVFVDRTELAKGDYAPLTRLRELQADANGEGP